MNKDLKEKFAFTLGATHVGIFHNTRRVGFTLAEVLITLGIIGIVSAMTIPTLVKNYEKQNTISTLKKAYSTINRAVMNRLIDIEHISFNLSSIEQIEKYWAPYLKIASIEPYSDNSDTNEFYYDMLGNQIWQPNTNFRRATFTLYDGIRYTIEKINSEDQIILADINGKKAPNKFGKDVFLFLLDLRTNSLSPYGFQLSDDEINSSCNANGDGQFCASKIIKSGWQIKDDYPW